MKGDIYCLLNGLRVLIPDREMALLFLSASFLNSATWHRITSQGDWKKATGLGVGLNMEVQESELPCSNLTSMVSCLYKNYLNTRFSEMIFEFRLVVCV